MSNSNPTGNATAKLSNGEQQTAYTFNTSDLLQGFSDADSETLKISALFVNNGELTNNKKNGFHS